MNKHIQSELINITIGIIIGATLGLLFGWAFGPHSLLVSDWVNAFVWAGAVSGTVCGLVVGIAKIVIRAKRYNVNWILGTKCAGGITGAILGGTLGVVTAAIIGITQIFLYPKEIYFTGQIDEVYYIPVIGVIFGGVYGLIRLTKRVRDDLNRSISSGVVFGLVSSVLLGLFMLIAPIIVGDSEPGLGMLIVPFIVMCLIAMISMSIFGTVVAVVGETVTGKFIKATI